MIPELQVTTHFSFLRGASSPEELFATAALLGIPALGIVDRGSLAGVVRCWEASKTTGVKMVVGARLDLTDGPSLLIYPTGRGRVFAPDPAAHARQDPRRQRQVRTRLGRRGGLERRASGDPAPGDPRP